MAPLPAQKHFKKLIDKLIPLLPEADRTKTQIIFLAGEITSFRHDTDRELLFRQESNFYWLTGCDVPASYILLTYKPQSQSYSSYLMIPEEDPLETMWSPPPPTLQEARALYDANEIGYTKTLSTQLQSLTSQNEAIVHTLPSTKLDYPIQHYFPNLPNELHALAPGRRTEEWLLKAIHRARLIKTEEEIELIKKANEISSRAHEAVMRVLGAAYSESKGQSPSHTNGTTAKGSKANTASLNPVLPKDWKITKEGEAEAIFVASCRREGAIHQAYLPIVASSVRAATLHYCCNDKAFAWGPLARPQYGHSHDTNGHQEVEQDFEPQVLLIDAGCEWNNYASDITRVTPVGNGGKFTKEANEIYSLVLKMQLACVDGAKPGIHWDSLHFKCHEILVQRFIELGIFKGDYEEVLHSGVSIAFFPHGLGHSIGLDVHDVPSASKPPLEENETIPESSKQEPDFYRYLRLRLPLEVNMVVTIEPGCYFSPHLLAPVRNSPFINHEVLAKYESVGGVRIEDVVVIRDWGCEVLTTVGKDVEWLEAVASGSA